MLKIARGHEVIIIKTRMTEEKYDKLTDNMEHMGWVPCKILLRERNPELDIKMIFANHKHLIDGIVRRKILKCNMCHCQSSTHTKYQCRLQLWCKFCKIKGHQPRYCPQSYCWICQANGHVSQIHRTDQRVKKALMDSSSSK